MFRSCRSPFISPLSFLGICPILQINEWQPLCPEKSRVSMSWEIIDLDEIVFFHKCKMENACLIFFLLLLNPCRTSWTIPHWVANEGSKKDSPTKPYNNPGADWHPWLWGGSKRIGLCCYFYIGFPWKHVDFCCHLWVVGTVFFWCPILTEPNRATFVPSEASYKSHSWEGIRCWTFWLKHVFFNSVFKTKFAHRKCHAAVHLNAFHGLGDVITPGT